MKRYLKSTNVNFEIVKYVVDDCLTNILKKVDQKVQKWLSYSILKLAVKNCILRKMILEFVNLIFAIFEKKLILKHFLHRTIPKRYVLGVFLTPMRF